MWPKLVATISSCLCFCYVDGTFYKTNVTDFSKCQIYYSRSGSVYKDFFEITQKQSDDYLLDFHFSVIAASDAHILLAPSDKVDKADPVYEIVIGAGGNTFCDIRRLQKASVKATVRVKGLLSALDPQSFWVHITQGSGKLRNCGVIVEKPSIHGEIQNITPLTSTFVNLSLETSEREVIDLKRWGVQQSHLVRYHHIPMSELRLYTIKKRNGREISNSQDRKTRAPHLYGVIEIGKEGEELAFLSWTDGDPLPLKVFSFSTWPGVEAKWYFNCPREDNSTTRSKEIERPLTPFQKLRRDLLFKYDPYVRPVRNISTISVVGLTIHSKLVSLDEHKSILDYIGSLEITWKDEKLIWDQANYSGINSFHIFRREIWVPDIYLFNGVHDIEDILEDTNLMVNSSGDVTWTTSLRTKTFCDVRDLGRWPKDEHGCDITLGFYREFQNIQLHFNANLSTFTTPYADRWEISHVEYIDNVGWKNNNSARNVLNFDPPALNLHFKLRRISTSYTVILYAPFTVIATCLLMTFWVSPFGPLKIALVCIQLIIISCVLITLGLIVPIHSKLVPNLVVLYSNSFIASLFAVLISTVVINLSRNEQKSSLPHFVVQILTSRVLKFLLCMPDAKSSEHYGNLNESMPKLNEDQQAMWILLGTVLDRLAFSVYLGLAVYAFCKID